MTRLDDIRQRAGKATDFTYEVSSDGRVFSIDSGWRGYGERELKQALNASGYPSVRLMMGGRRKRVTVHSLVAAAFLPPRPSGKHEVRHLDGDKHNNRAENLAWGTACENAEDRERHGRTARGGRNGARLHPQCLHRGERCHNAKLTTDLVRTIRARHRAGDRLASIAQSLGVSERTVRTVALEQGWRHVAD